MRNKNLKTRNKIVRLLTATVFLFMQINPVLAASITHSADTDFNPNVSNPGVFDRINDVDAGAAPKLESYYQEPAADPYTVGLWHFDGNSNDSSGKAHNGTLVDTATVSGATQFMGNVLALDGTGDYVTIPDSDDWAFGTGNFSFETWVKYSTLSGNRALFTHEIGTNYIEFYHNSTNLVFVTAINDVIKAHYSFAWSPSMNVWYHVALVRNGTNLYIFINGVSQTLTVTTAISTNALPDPAAIFTIGAFGDGNGATNGFFDEVRILKGRALTPEEIKAAASRRPDAVYTSPVLDATASVQWDTLNWTEGGVNTGDGETLYNSSGLVAQWNFNETSGTTADNAEGTSALDGTLTNFASTGSQDAAAGTGWTDNNKRWGAGALMFDGTNDYVSVGDSDNWAFGTGDFSIDLWTKPLDSTPPLHIQFFGQDVNAENRTLFKLNVGGDLEYQVLEANVNTILFSSATNILSENIWHHIALTRSGNVFNIYVDGISVASATNTSSVPNYAAPAIIGYYPASGGYYNGFIDSIRIYKGRALSAAEILSNYNAGNIEFQTRTGATSDPNDGTWEAWKPTTGETQLLSMDSDAANWNLWDGSATSTTFNYTGGQQTYTVPAGVTKVTATLYGAQGGGSGGGLGGLAVATFNVTPGNVLNIYVGGSGSIDTGGYNGGGNSSGSGSGHGYGGGGASDVRLNGISTSDRVIVAAGGGGASFQNNCGGGNGGGTVGNSGSCAGGQGGTQTSGGNGSTVASPGSNGAFFQGGAASGGMYPGGGGGGGYYGGGGGSGADLYNTSYYGGGGGGSGYIISTATGTSTTSGVQSGNGQVVISPFVTIRGNNETTIKQEGSGSTKLTLGAPQVDGNTVALWHMEETSGTGAYIKDSTANANNATPTGTTVVDGIFGKARKFNSSSDYLTSGTVATYKNFHGAADTSGFKWTIDFWTKINSFPAAHQYFIGSTLNADTDAGFNIILFATSREIGLQIGRNGGVNTYVISGSVGSGTYPNDNGWHHVAVTYDQSLSSGNAKGYIDGVYLGSNTKTAQVPETTDADEVLRIGQSVTGTAPLNGAMDELRMTYGRALSADEIAETYRMGANHHLTRQISAADLSSSTKLPFYIAADRPGTYLEATVGESAYANYEADANTVLYVKGDEISGSTSIKDSSLSGKTITAVNDAKVVGGGKIGNALSFDGTGDYLEVADNSDWDFTASDGSIDFWVYPNSVSGGQSLVGQTNSGADGNWFIYIRASAELGVGLNGSTEIASSGYSLIAGAWFHIAVVKSGNTTKIYKNGIQVASSTTDVWNNATTFLRIGGGGATFCNFNGYIDELRIIKGTALTPDQIRQAYEYGLRSHPITIDFAAKLDSANLISGSGDTSFTVDATTYGLSQKGSNLYPGDKVIVRENIDGTEYIVQGTVKSVPASSGALTVGWDSGLTFPSGGFTVNAAVFKWQREYFDLTGSLSTHRDAITNLTLRPTNGAEGRTIYLDDCRFLNY
ncbi:MAG: hypothetical protein UW91_C0034G0002 [Parcubacteria group bacterium GW2011_GWF2_45_11]|nr:MAG: hypothetical protein UW91_C0034G0002 [Parcubacteria group bacterium GW2011_GWF2_45_11]